MNYPLGWRKKGTSEVGLSSELKGVLKEGVVTSSKGGNMILEETRAAMKVEITEPPLGIVAVDMREVDHLKAIREDTGFRKICDYLLASSSNARDLVVLVELKKTLRDGSEAKEQLRRSLPVLEYLRSFCEIHYERSSTELEVRHFIIAERMVGTSTNRQSEPHQRAG